MRETPWKEKISTDLVMIYLQSLKRNGQLPVGVQKIIYKEGLVELEATSML